MKSFLRSKWIWPAALLYLIGLILLILKIEPRAFSFAEIPNGVITRDMVFGPFQMHPFGEDYVSVPTSQFRGDPARRGVYENERIDLNLEVQELAKTLNVEVHAASKSSPAIDDSGLYVGSDSGWFYKLGHDGSLKWKFNMASASKGIHATAVLDQKRAYIGAYNGRLYALDKETGRPDWILEMGVAIGASAVIHDNALYVAIETAHPNGYVAKIRPSDGRVLWLTRWLGAHPHSSPTLWPEKNLLFVGANNMKMHAIDMQTGAIKWTFNGEGQIKGTAALMGSELAFTSWGRKLFLLDALTGEDLWESFIGGESQSSPAYVPDLDLLVVHAAGGKLMALERKTGHIRWSLDTGMRRSILSATVTRAAAGPDWIVWTKCQTETFCALDARTGRSLKSWKVGVLTGAPIPFKGEIYLSLDFPDTFIKLGRPGKTP
jgi:outer membrane protein assembly factor BamB